MKRRRLLALLAALVAPVGVWQSGAWAQDPPPVTVPSALPGWVAPGGMLSVRGTAAPGELVSLHVGTAKLVEQAALADGSFRLRARVKRAPGVYPVAVEAARDPIVRVELGTLRVRPLRLFAVGDVNLGDRVALAMSVYGVRYPWLDVAGLLWRADVAIANLECAVSRRGSPWPGKRYTFRGSPYALRTMAHYASVDVVSLANNHTLDYGRLAFADTIYYARLYGMKTIGGGRNLAAARRPAVVRTGGLRIAFLGYSDVRPLGFDATATQSGTAPAFPSYIAADVRAARDVADFVAVYFHWGIERTSSANARQRYLARVALDAGAKVVLGAHPHVLQPIERPTTRKLVAWSLGNFVFGANSPETARTGILRMRTGYLGVLDHKLRRARIAGPYSVQPQLY